MQYSPHLLFGISFDEVAAIGKGKPSECVSVRDYG